MNKVYTIIITMLMLLSSHSLWAQRPRNLSDNEKLDMMNKAIDKAPDGHGPGPGAPGRSGGELGPVKRHTSSKYSLVKDAKIIFIYGMAYNPTDSVIYLTDELILDSAQVYKKKGFLVNREEYSAQLKNFVESIGEKYRTCTVTYATTIGKLDKMYRKEMKYLKKRGYLVKHVDQTEFRFHAVRNHDL